MKWCSFSRLRPKGSVMKHQALVLALLVLPVMGQASSKDLASRLGSGVSWTVDDPRLLEEGRNRNAVRESIEATKDFDRSGALETALADAKSRKRLVLWYVPRILAATKITSPGRQMYRPAILDLYVKAVLFSDPDLVELMNRKFISVRLACDEKLGERFDIRAPDTVEPAFIVLTPGGEVARRIQCMRSFNAAWFFRVLRDVLNTTKGYDAPSAALKAALDGPTDLGALATETGRDGQDLGAVPPQAKELNPEMRAPLLLAHARSHRVYQRTADALATLAEAGKVAEGLAPPESSGGRRRRGRAHPLVSEVHCERGRVLLEDGKLREAAAEFIKASSGPRAAEAWYHRGLCEFFDRNETFALRHWKEAVAVDQDSPWAWRAAANLIDGEDRTSFGPTWHGFESPFVTAAPTKAAESTAFPRDPDQAESLAHEGVRFLLRMQRENGGWTDSRYAYWPSPQLTPNAWVAATSVACTALLEWRDLEPEGVDKAIRRGEMYMFDERHMNRTFQEEVYADGYKLLYLARKYDLARSDDARRGCVDQMNRVVRFLFERQGTGQRGKGFWGHEYPNPFTTASVMNALYLCKQRGARIPTKVMRDGAEALLSVRDDGGAFAYGAGRPPRGKSEDRMKNSMGRSPICEAAILWSGHEKGSVENVAKAMDNFWKYLPRLHAIRQCDFHTDGELAGFFFWHAVFHTTESVKVLPAADRERHEARLLKYITTLGELDGSFVDSHEMGKGYGTAMGLLSLKNTLEVNR